MTKNEIIEISKLKKEEYLKCLIFEVHSNLFEELVTYQIFFDETEGDSYELTEQILSSVNCVLGFDFDKKEWLENLCFEHYGKCISYTDYMTPDELLIKHNNDYSKANMEFFGIYNSQDAHKNIKLNSIDVLEQNNDGTVDIWTIMNFSVPWENEHGMRINFKNEAFAEVE